MTAAILAPRCALTREELVMLAAAYSELLATARASVAAAELGEVDPLVYVREHLAEHGQLPAAGARPVVLLAQSAVPSMHRAGVA
ncbi:hypothetical protein EDD27_1472 [Nonomuraea polychroma]|uniref:Uncharacterized protein n=1 Tax=Nonomuraea polychroma TaxID=46176 RepID=A0A438M011_9ACTN|nr:hypothetical protein [Nonomuraea polychroma]RVX39129.1 hypothetical protein EDD27_1472 [Nonomuraea polychroma]